MRVFCLALCAFLAVGGSVKLGDQDWWKSAVIYQIYPRSFMDSNNDGVGDLQGINSRLDHLVQLGVTAIWLSPIYKSPMKDFGYDVSDFRDIDPIFGTMDDFLELVDKAHKLKIKVIMDFVPNHTSDEHEWFQKALSGIEENKYRSYYIWADAPCNWISYFHGPAWTKPEGQTQYYLHQFHKGQPDLNFRNHEVRTEMKDILTFWMDKGVDGFRVDTVPSLVEDLKAEGDSWSCEDEELSGDPNCSDDDRCYLKNVHQGDQDLTFDVVYEWRKHLDDYVADKEGDARIMMTESYSPMDKILKYYGNEDGSKQGAHFSFNFRYITEINKDSNAKEIAEVTNDWITQIEKQNHTHNWVLGNHDQHRLATRYGLERADGMIMLQMMLPGVAVTYMGEEIGMENGEVTFDQGKDPQGIDAGQEHFAAQSRDFERTPFQWDFTHNAGFNIGMKPWLPVGRKYKEVNVANQEGDYKSPLEMYKILVNLRNTKAFKNNEVLVTSNFEDKVLVVVRGKPNIYTYVLVMNTDNSEVTIDWTAINLPSLGKTDILMVHATSRNSDLTTGDILGSTAKLKLKPSESIIVGY